MGQGCSNRFQSILKIVLVEFTPSKRSLANKNIRVKSKDVAQSNSKNEKLIVLFETNDRALGLY
jgi:hypothetical protein